MRVCSSRAIPRHGLHGARPCGRAFTEPYAAPGAVTSVFGVYPNKTWSRVMVRLTSAKWRMRRKLASENLANSR